MPNEKREIFKPIDIHRAYIDCRKRKRCTVNALRFEIEQDKNLLRLEKELNSGRYYPSRSVCFIIKKPKTREIFAADFYDRVVHHLVVRNLETHWEKRFIHDSYACRKGKGSHSAVERLSHFLRSTTCNGTERMFFLQFDVENFFMSVDKNRLYKMLCGGIKKQFKNEEYCAWKNLIRILLHHDPCKSYIRKCGKKEWDSISPAKSLFNCKKGYGMPIGNLTSQFFANVYLNHLDQFIKRKLKIKKYIRYVDDAVILHESRSFLEDIYRQIEIFLEDELDLRLKAKAKQLKPVSCGINFLGYIVHTDHILTRKRVVNNFVLHLENLKNEWGNLEEKRDEQFLKKLEAEINSYSAHFKRSDSFNLRKRIYEENRWIDEPLKLLEEL